MADNRKSLLDQLPLAITFEAVARLGSFRAAAGELGIARSTASDHVAALEASLGLRLLHRTTRRVRLTDAGAELRDATATMMARWSIVRERVRSHGERPQGRVVLTSSDLLMATLVVPALVRFRAQHPDVEVILRTSTDNLDLVADGIDLALRAGPLQPSGYGARELWRGPHIAVASVDWGEPGASHPDDLADIAWIELSGRPRLDFWSNAGGESAAHVATPTIVADTPHVFLELIAGGAGCGTIPELLVADALREGRLRRLLPNWTQGTISFHAVTPSPRGGSAAAEAFLDVLLQRLS